MKKIILFLLANLIIFPVAAKTEKKSKGMPDWCINPYSSYSKANYFTAVGTAKNKNDAEIRAIEDITAIFGFDIYSEKTAESFIALKEIENQSEKIMSSSISSKTLIEVNQDDLIGIEIADSFFDETKKEWYVIAVLDKEKTGSLYENMIKQNVSSINMLISTAKKLPSSMNKIAYYYHSLQLAKLNESYYPRFEMIHPAKFAACKKDAISSTSLKIEFDKVAEDFPVAVNVDGDKDGIVAAACEEMLKTFGICVDLKSNKNILSVSVNPSYREVDNPKMTYCEFSLSSKISSNGAVSVPWNFAGRAGGKNEDLATQKAYALISEKIKNDYRAVFEQYFYGEKE